MSSKKAEMIEKGFRQVKLSKEDHNRILKNRKIGCNKRIEVFTNDNVVYIHYYFSLLGVIRNMIITPFMFPVVVVMHGLVEFNQIWSEVKDVYSKRSFELKDSRFFSKNTVRGSKIFDELNSCIVED